MPCSSKALACAALLSVLPAAPGIAQYYLPYGYGNAYPGYVGGSNGYAANRQLAINQCANAAQARLGSFGAARVLGITDARALPGGGAVVRGVASSGSYAYGYGMQAPVDLIWRCSTDFRGFVVNVSIDRANYARRYNDAPWTNDYSQFGYYRY